MSAELIAQARGKYKSLDGVVVVSPKLPASLAVEYSGTEPIRFSKLSTERLTS